jgi:hypothetical protein
MAQQDLWNNQITLNILYVHTKVNRNNRQSINTEKATNMRLNHDLKFL